MKLSGIPAAITLLSLFSSVLASKYGLTDKIVGSAFYNAFNFEAIADPVHGRVNYVDQATAQSLNLTFASRDTFILRTDFSSVLSPDGPGRDAIRIRSKKKYSTHVAVFDIRHMPEGCGTWPAVREKSEASQPNGGLVDIIEGVNDLPPDLVTLQTTAGCTMPASRNQTGTSTTLDCNAGCSVKMNTSQSYGPAFNSNGGGWFAVERTGKYIKIWFWARHDRSVPHDVRNGEWFVDTKHWGTPSAYFPDTTCDFDANFSEHTIMITITLCGDWAGSAGVYPSTCPSTCVDNVNNNPSSFVNAYFDFASIRVYT